MISFLRSKSWITIAAISAALFHTSCKKVSPMSVDNDAVIQTPYGLYLANSYGKIWNTTDGKHFNSVFPADGFAPIAMATSKENLLIAKENLHFSSNNGKNFVSVYNRLNHQPWNEQIVDVPLQNRMYVTSIDGKGVAVSADNGRTWTVDAAFNPLMPPFYNITSFAALNDGAVYAFSHESLMLVKKENADAEWNPVTIEGLFPADDGEYFLSGDGVSLFLIDHSGRRSHYISDNGGVHWTRVTATDLGGETKVLTAARAPGGHLLVGTDGRGIYRQVGDEFKHSSHGLEDGLSVKRLTVKKNFYKNGSEKYFIFAATNKGLYVSEDKGLNWDLTSDTSFSHDYRAMY